jgi:F-type H+-transporting ATPase subunit b
MGEFSVGTLIWSIVVFGTLLAILSRFAYKPLNELLAKREKTIRDSLDEAAKARHEAQELIAHNQKQLEEARDHARQIIDEGHKIIATMKMEAHKQAKQESDELVARTRHEIQQETQRSLDELKGTVAGLSVRIARQIIRENLNEERHEELANLFIDRLKKTHAKRKS